MKNNVAILLLGLNIFLNSCNGYDKKENNRFPNVVLIVADDLGYGDLGCYGCMDIKSPNLDRLAAGGVRFTQFYSNGPECTPTRTALLSGRYQQRAGGLECALGAGNVARYDEAEWLWRKKELGLPPELNVLAPMLKGKGYATAMFGKWHLGYESKFRPDKQGFDYSFGNIGFGGDYFHHTEQESLNLDDFTGTHNLALNGKEVFRTGRYMTNLITKEAVAWINQLKDYQPFFIYLPFTAPHTPYQGPNDNFASPLQADQWNEGTREKYKEMVECLDDGIGQVLKAIELMGFDENTLVIFFSDNGGAKLANNGNLRGNKGQVYEGGIRVPCIIKWPGKIEKNSTTKQVAISFDLTRSILELAGVKTESLKLDGYDIVKHVVAKESNFHRMLFWRSKRGERVRKATRYGDYKYIIEFDGAEIVNEKFFNLLKDPYETNDILKQRLPEMEVMKSKLDEWEKQVQSVRLKDFKPQAK